MMFRVLSSISRYTMTEKVPTFQRFSSLLRLSTKYMMHSTRVRMVEIAEQLYPITFDAWECWWKNAFEFGYRQSINMFPGQTPHPNSVINLFRKCHVMKCLPMAYHDACLKGVSPLFDVGGGYHAFFGGLARSKHRHSGPMSAGMDTTTHLLRRIAIFL